ncbi:hypothetical protein E2C01_078026 [Portunus trituberculatus]|uniref:Uncharacterized protein n=1 Tax=Portunus trituberculatus TaxID=210409 RepID=A0A5B7IRM2_PORTR|nr:hypothetical protein [Portunus trituberculatus]
MITRNNASFVWFPFGSRLRHVSTPALGVGRVFTLPQ